MSLPPALSEHTPDADHIRWFKDEVHPHDASLKAYLRVSFPAVRDVEDMVQESYLRVWKAKLAHPITSTKSFLFQIARRLAIDTARKNRTAPTDNLGDLAEISVIDSGPDAAAALSYREKTCLLADALTALPARCREIVILRKYKFLPQKDVAAQLGISERTVESQLARGMKLCEVYLRKHGIESFSRDGK